MHVHTWSSSTTPSRSQTTRTGPDDFSGYVLAITNLDGRLLKKPMSIIVEVLAENEYLAKFPESGIGIAGDFFATQSLHSKRRSWLPSSFTGASLVLASSSVVGLRCWRSTLGKRGGSKLLRKDAEDIARKLRAATSSGAHITAAVHHNGVLVASFGIRHGSRSAHGHLPGALHLSQSQTVQLARCQISRDQYFELLRKKGLLTPARS